MSAIHAPSKCSERRGLSSTQISVYSAVTGKPCRDRGCTDIVSLGKCFCGDATPSRGKVKGSFFVQCTMQYTRTIDHVVRHYASRHCNKSELCYHYFVMFCIFLCNASQPISSFSRHNVPSTNDPILAPSPDVRSSPSSAPESATPMYKVKPTTFFRPTLPLDPDKTFPLPLTTRPPRKK